MRRRGLRSQITNHKSQIRQRGYMMITLMLTVALITLALLTVLPDTRQQIVRDREDEMRHRGTAYMRAIQHFYKKFGRYPTKVEDLENTNNVRFLRKRYTDPMNRDPKTGKERDFKFLHQQDITLNNGPVMPGQSSPAGQSAFGGQGGFAGPGGVQGSGFGGAQGAFGGAQSGLGGLGGISGGAQPNASSNSQTSSSDNSGNPSSGTSSSGNASDAGENSSSPGSSSSNSSGGSSNSGSSSGSGLNGQTFGGGPILGVASTSKAKSIRVFYDKDHYNDWLFVYLPQADRGGLLVGPVTLNGATPNLGGGLPGQAGGLPGQSGGLPGQGGFGGFGQGLTPNGGQGQGLQPQSPQTPAPQTPQQQ